MSRNKTKGTMAETAIVDFFNAFYPEEQEQIGYLWSRAPSKGGADEGDVFGPYTSIEVKNRPSSTPINSQLLSNAEWKANNSGRKFWCLASKPKGFGLANIHQWPVAITLGDALSMFGVDRTPEELVQDEEPRTVWADPLGVQFGIMVRHSNTYTDLWGKLSAYLVDTSDEPIPAAMIFPRKLDGETADIEKWFFCMNLDNFAFALQLCGVLPRRGA